MSDQQLIENIMYDAATGEELEGDFQFMFTVKPAVGEDLHYWQDGTEDSVSGVPVRRDFIVRRIRHDLRYMPARGGRPHYVQTLEIFVDEVKL